MSLHSAEELKIRQALPLELKIRISKQRIKEWVDEYGVKGVYVSFSGGKDSTVLLDLVREDFPEVPAVFVDTGLEYPEIREFVKSFKNVVWIKPKMNFKKVIQTYGYPFISKEVSRKVWDFKKNPDGYAKAFFTPAEKGGKFERYNISRYNFLISAPFCVSHLCCNVMKKEPLHRYEKETKRKPIIGTMAEESDQRASLWLRQGCNSFEGSRPISRPLSTWTNQDVLKYIIERERSPAFTEKSLRTSTRITN